MGKLQGEVAIVTGGGRGIGKGITKRFSAEGALVVIAQRDPASAPGRLKKSKRGAGMPSDEAVVKGAPA